MFGTMQENRRCVIVREQHSSLISEDGIEPSLDSSRKRSRAKPLRSEEIESMARAIVKRDEVRDLTDEKERYIDL